MWRGTLAARAVNPNRGYERPMGAVLRQMSLFAEPAREPAPVDPDFVRRHLTHLLRLAQTAERLPWSEAEAVSWEKLFAELAGSLPDGEGEALLAGFERELGRLRLGGGG